MPEGFPARALGEPRPGLKYEIRRGQGMVGKHVDDRILHPVAGGLEIDAVAVIGEGQAPDLAGGGEGAGADGEGGGAVGTVAVGVDR
ncbi:hypothetical protein [Inquilinus sp.]|uniref:hypothetical protein n=1 Tax=Inquilinus sp. TaxID=1932117 RepID=UPI003F675C88